MPNTAASTRAGRRDGRAGQRSGGGTAAAAAEAANGGSPPAGAASRRLPRPTRRYCSRTAVRPAWISTTRRRRWRRRTWTTFIIDNGGQLLLDVLGVTDIENCFTKGDVVACLWTLVDLIPPAKLAKLGDFVAKIAELAPKIAKFIEDLKKAKQLLEQDRCAPGDAAQDQGGVRAGAPPPRTPGCANPDDDPNPGAPPTPRAYQFWRSAAFRRRHAVPGRPCRGRLRQRDDWSEESGSAHTGRIHSSATSTIRNWNQ